MQAYIFGVFVWYSYAALNFNDVDPIPVLLNSYFIIL